MSQGWRGEEKRKRKKEGWRKEEGRKKQKKKLTVAMNDEIRELRTYLSKEFNLKKRRPNALCIKNFPEQRTV